MKKILLALLSVFALTLAFQSCSKTRTYADRLADEKRAIDKYLKSNNLKVISKEEFFKQDTLTGVDEYVELQTGLYMNIVSRGDQINDKYKFKNRDEITVRFEEYNIMEGFETIAGNSNNPFFVDAFILTKSNSGVRGEFVDRGNMHEVYGSKAVPSGWLIPLDYIRYGAHIKLIVSSKLGHTLSSQQVYPYAYNLTRLAPSKR